MQQQTTELVRHEGDTWKVLGRGAKQKGGLRLCHLASTTQFRKQRNGLVPIQMVDAIDESKIYTI